MHHFSRDKQEQGFDDISKGVEECESQIELEDQTLRELFIGLKTDLLDNFLQPGTAHLSRDHIRILREQVDHVVQLAVKIDNDALKKSFEDEEATIRQVESLLEEFPSADVSSSPDLRSLLEQLRSLMHRQQALIFDRHDILAKEKQQLIAILSQVDALRQLHRQEDSLSLQKGKSTEY